MALPKDETPQGKNRFIYSQNKGCWIIEFENDVFCLTNYDKVSIIAKTIQYILKHGNLDIRSAIEKCTWFYLDEAKPIIPSFLGLIDKKTDSRTINEVKKKLKELNEQLKQINNTSEKKKIKKEANKCEVYLIENSNYSIPRNFHPELGNMRNRIRKRKKDFMTNIQKDHVEFYNHLEDTLKNQQLGIVYQSNVKWITEDKIFD